MNVCETIKQLNSEKTDAFMHELYGKGAAENKARYEKVLKGFEQAFWRQQRSPSFLITGPYRDQRKPHRPQPRQGAGRQH